MNAFDLGVAEGMSKIAFGKAEAERVLRLAKKKQLPKASRRIVPNLTAIPDAKRMRRGAEQAMAEMPEGAREALKPMIEEMTSSAQARLAKRTKGPGVIAPGGNIEKHVADMAEKSGIVLPRLPKRQKKMQHAVLKGHELDELTPHSSTGAAQFGHRSPEVIFKEHNRVVTLPKDHKELQDYMRTLRSTREGRALFPKGMEYGHGKRLSRHARKRLKELADKRARKANIRQYEELVAMGALK